MIGTSDGHQFEDEYDYMTQHPLMVQQKPLNQLTDKEIFEQQEAQLKSVQEQRDPSGYIERWGDITMTPEESRQGMPKQFNVTPDMSIEEVKRLQDKADESDSDKQNRIDEYRKKHPMSPPPGREKDIIQPPDFASMATDRQFASGLPSEFNPTETWPTDEDVATSRKYDTTYGTKAAGFTEAGKSKIRDVSVSDISKVYKNTVPSEIAFAGAKSKLTTPEQADQVTRQWIAANKSAIATLGFEPRQTMSTMGKAELNVGGFYDREPDLMWFDRRSETSGVHEAFHRGIQKLREAGAISAASSREEEMLVRALMLKHFEDIEKAKDTNIANKQVEAARSLVNHKFLTELEDAAAKLLAKKTPRGPR